MAILAVWLTPWPLWVDVVPIFSFTAIEVRIVHSFLLMPSGHFLARCVDVQFLLGSLYPKGDLCLS